MSQRAPIATGASARSAPSGARVHIERVSIVADGASGGDVQRNAERLAGEIGAALSKQVGHGRVRIGELSLRIATDQLGDASARERIAAGVARRILDSVQD